MHPLSLFSRAERLAPLSTSRAQMQRSPRSELGSSMSLSISRTFMTPSSARPIKSPKSRLLRVSSYMRCKFLLRCSGAVAVAVAVAGIPHPKWELRKIL